MNLPSCCRFVLLAALLLTLAGCESDGVIWIAESDNGKTFNAAVGDTLKVKLWGNPTTGYTWNPAAISTNVLVQTSVDFEADSDDAGAGGYYYFCYKAQGAGTAGVSMTYNRVFEPNELPVKTFQVTIAVGP